MKALYILVTIFGIMCTAQEIKKDQFLLSELPHNIIGEILMQLVKSSSTYTETFKHVTTFKILSKNMHDIERQHHQKVINHIIEKHENPKVRNILNEVQTPEQANATLLSCSLVFQLGNGKYDFLHNYYNDTGKRILNMHKFVVKILQEKGANLDTKNLLNDKTILTAPSNDAVTTMKGSTPLFCAITANQTLEFIHALLMNGANPNLPNENGQTPLMIARSKGSDPIVELLLQYNADVSAKDNDGNTVFLEKYNTFQWSIQADHLRQMACAK